MFRHLKIFMAAIFLLIVAFQNVYAVERCPDGFICSAANREKCERLGNCQDNGQCIYKQNTQWPGCYAVFDKDCAQSKTCKQTGACHLIKEMYLCAPVSDDDCRRSTGCLKDGACIFFAEGEGRNQIRQCVRNKRFAQAQRSEKECKSLGGRWEKVGMLQQLMCVLATTDKRKPCKGSKECEGGCINYKCSDTNIVLGCGIITNGKIACAD